MEEKGKRDLLEGSMGLRVDESKSFRSQQAKSKSKYSAKESKIKQFPHWKCPHNQRVATIFVSVLIKGVESHLHGFSMKSELALGSSLCYRKVKGPSLCHQNT